MTRAAPPTPDLRPGRPDGSGALLVALGERAAAGDPGATRQFLDAVWPTVTRVAVGVLGSGHADVDDVVQQSLLGIVQALGAFRGECHPLGYASRIALHVALRARRQAATRRTRFETLAQLSPTPPGPATPGEEAADERRRRVLRDLLQDLPEEQADSLALRLVLGWSLEEVADATGAPMNTVRSRIRLAKEALRRRIEATPGLADELEVRP
jgi:RNA polymerase sigma factor (sigma-70 family)